MFPGCCLETHTKFLLDFLPGIHTENMLYTNGLVYSMFSVCIPGRRSIKNVNYIAGEHLRNSLCVSQLFSGNTRNQRDFIFQLQTNKIIIMCFPFVSVGNSLHVFWENRDFTCFPVPLSLENSLHLQQ